MAEDNSLGAIEQISLHRVGNKANEEGMVLTAEPLQLEWQLTDALQIYFKAPLKTQEFYKLYHESELELNEVYSFVKKIFDDPTNTHEQSVKLAKHLFECSTHPNIKGGEFYTVFFKHCLLNEELIDAVGLFKSENKDTFLKVNPSGDNFVVKTDEGINIDKLDKGCIIFNTNAEDGYLVNVVDNTNKQVEARYWIDDFLQLKQMEDAYFHTQSVMAMAKSFITKELPQQFDVEKADQADLLNKSVKFFKEQDSFNMNDFEAEVIVQPEVISQFQQYSHDYQQEREMYVPDAFDISEKAVKKKQGTFKSVIKLDKNFSLYVHGDRSMIERGEDPDGRQYYKLYFEEER